MISRLALSSAYREAMVDVGSDLPVFCPRLFHTFVGSIIRLVRLRLAWLAAWTICSLCKQVSEGSVYLRKRAPVALRVHNFEKELE